MVQEVAVATLPELLWVLLELGMSVSYSLQLQSSVLKEILNSKCQTMYYS